ncbi:tyrosine-type recombinase/integrase [Arcobacter arenosus]|uniref:Site-specific integrase n=1 Tax=Arcobacter arenosus TaxID=2576037 RepID=A0A5R8Y4N2_9BACT|nr:site-specific integrase [Arcobacter arenosus]TLP41077.1 site-specific integrase [Arcobacter arenosus]
MKFFNRKGMLYVRINGERFSTKLKDTKANRKLFESYCKNDEFFIKFNVGKSVPKLIELCEEVLREKESTLKTSSYRSYDSLYNSKIVPYFSKMLVSEIKPRHIEEWYKTFDDRQSINTCEAILRPSFEKALIREFITSSPLVIKKPSSTTDYSINPFNLLEIQKLIKNAPPILKNLIPILFYTGARPNEILNLKWENVNLNIGDIYITDSKTKSGIRTIDMLSQCEIYLREQFKITGNREYVFLNTKNLPYLSSANFNYSWDKLLKTCNLEKRGIYQLRHSFASNMLSNGEDLLWVSQMLGHKNPSITLSRYSKYIKSKRERKTTFLDDFSTKSTHQDLQAR